MYWRKGCGIIREVLDVMRRYYAANRREIQESGYFFVNNRGNRYTEQSIRLMVGKYTSECGISQKITPHMFRHSFATYLIEEGVDISCVQEILGHSSIKTTRIYYGKKKLMTSCTDGSAYLQRYPPEQLSIINASGH